jgi:hypothetical protein
MSGNLILTRFHIPSGLPMTDAVNQVLLPAPGRSVQACG